MLCFGWGLGISFLGWAVVDLAGVGADLVVEDFEGVVVGFLDAEVCLLVVEEEEEEGLVFLGGSLGIFFFGSGMVSKVQ